MRKLLTVTGVSLLAAVCLPAWLAPPVRDFQKPKPKYEVRLERSVMVPMRDGVKLSTDLYFPVGVEGKLPIILSRSPYNKNNYRDPKRWPHFFASQGYIFAVQDMRGRFESEGEYVVSAADREDGYDAIEWLSTQPWSNGKVGTYGCSYLGENQMQQAAMRHPNHAAALPQAAGGSYRYFGLYMGGAVELAAGFGWFLGNGSKYYLGPPPDAPADFWAKYGDMYRPAPKRPEDVDFQKMWMSLPLVDMMKKAGGPVSDFEDFMSHGPGDPYWDALGYVNDQDRFDVPALHVNSWYDLGVADTLKLFNLMRTNAESPRGRDNQFVIISPAVHCRSEVATEKTIIGKRDLGDARLDYWNIYVRWFDYWLKGIDNGLTQMPKVQIYVMGKNEWRGENEWPLARTQLTPYYFHSDGSANSRFGTGTLSTKKPGDEPADEFVYDPKTPVPTVGGPLCCTGTRDAEAGAYDQRNVETREDILVFTTPVLKEGVEVTGPMKVVLYVSSTAKDTDFTAKLVDVYPDGTAYNVEEGILRARYREGYDKQLWMESGEVYELRIDLQATSNYFGPGHRIRLEISSSSFPRYDRNLNTGGDNYSETEWVIARNSVLHSRKYPSRVILPVIPEGSEKPSP